MEAKSFANDKGGPGVETAASKKMARKSTTTVRKKEPKYGASQDDPSSLELFEVVSNIQEHLRVASVTGQDPDPNNRSSEGNSFVVEDEVVVNMRNTKDPQKFFDLACRIQAEKAKKNNFMPVLGDTPAADNPYAAVMTNKMIFREVPFPSVESTNSGAGAEDSGCPNYDDNEETVSDSILSPRNADDNDGETERERSADGVSSIETVPEGGAAREQTDPVVEASGSGTGTKNDSSAPEENAEKNSESKDNKNVPYKAPDKVPEKNSGSDALNAMVKNLEDAVVSLGFSWADRNRPATEQCDTAGNTGEEVNEEEDDLIGKFKMNEAGHLELVKRIKGKSVAENGTAVETREGRLVEKTGEEDKRVIQDGEIGSVAGEILIQEANKRKLAEKDQEAKNMNAKKRKVDKGKNGSGDGKDKGKSHGDKGSKKDSVKPGSSICDQSKLEETIDRVASGHLSLPFIESLRSEIRSLSRADLEELIVQKLCEAITERSAVGHLRKRAEALEKNQERWKEKVQSLTKQIKEMDMVMKNYLNEVRRHQAEKNFQPITPLRVTRSVGLQVSFTSTPSKAAKTMEKASGDSNPGREKAGKSSNRSVPVSSSVPVSQPPNKKIPILPTTSPKTPLVMDPKNKFSTKSGLTITLQPASSSTEAQYASKPIPIQQPKLSILPAPNLPSTSLIDLTKDDDQQVEASGVDTTQPTLTVAPPGQVKVVNHIQPAQNPAPGTLTLLLSNAPSPQCCSSTTTIANDTQLAIPGSSTDLTQRHILPAISTLIYKPNALIQPGSHVVTTQARPSPTKPAKPSAPLPEPQVNPVNNPTWKLSPPRPVLKVSKGDAGILLSWNVPLGPEYETIVSYQLFANQESDSPSSPTAWKYLGDIAAIRLPMACTLTQFQGGGKFNFAVRAVDIQSRAGPLSLPISTTLLP